MYTQPKDKLQFRDIVLKHIEKISELTLSEFRGGYFREIPIGNFIQKEYVPDTRKCYIQAVEWLSDVLLFKFDKEMKEENNKILIEIGKVQKNYETIKAKKKKLGEDYEIDLVELIEAKLKLARLLFQQLSLLLYRIQFLKAGEYMGGEEDEDKVIDIDKERE